MNRCLMRDPVVHNLRVAVNRLITDNQRSDGPEIELCHDLDNGELRPALQVPVLCIVRELLLNACQHSKSKQILVGIAQDDTHVYIQVQDWGVGFNSMAVAPNRGGLEEVHHLAQWLGGTVDIDTRIGNGTCVVVEIPLLRDDDLLAPHLDVDQGNGYAYDESHDESTLINL